MINRIMSGLTLFFLLVLLQGCSSSAPEIIRVPYERTVVEKVQAPEALLEPCLVPDLVALETNKDLETALGEAIVSLETCNKDKERIKDWQAE